MNRNNHERYGLDVGSTVVHVKDSVEQGIITEIDDKYDLGDITTCRVVWGAETLEDAKSTPREDQDIQWTNKLVALTVEPGERPEIELLSLLKKADPLVELLPEDISQHGCAIGLAENKEGTPKHG